MAVNPTYADRSVTHSIRAFATFDIVKQEDGTIKTDIVPLIETGASEAQIQTSQDTNTIYADGVPHVVSVGTKEVTGTLTFRQFTSKMVTDYAGYNLEPNGTLTDAGVRKNFGCQFIETVTDEFGAEYDFLHIYYNTQITSSPEVNPKTDDNGVQTRDYAYPCNFLPNSLVVNDIGKTVTELIIPANTADLKKLVDLAYKQVLLPATAVPEDV
jgi:hypothetical protein